SSRRRHTRSKRDWSSDVCSSDLNMNKEVSGTLRLGSSSNFAHYELPDILEGFIDAHSAIDIQLKTGWSSDILDQLQEESIHVAFIRGVIQWNGGKMLINEEYMSIVSKDKRSE